MSEPRPLSAEEEARLRYILSHHGRGVDRDIRARLLATLDAARTPAEPLDVERLARALDACLPEPFVTSKPGNRVRAKAIAREYAALGDSR